MSEILFYHLAHTTTPATLADLLSKCSAKGWRVGVRAGEGADLARLDQDLWALQAPDAFVPHGLQGSTQDHMQPVLLGVNGEFANEADVLMLINGAEFKPEEITKFARVCLIFDGNAEAEITKARKDWKAVAAANVPAQYWSQETGTWQQKLKTS